MALAFSFKGIGGAKLNLLVGDWVGVVADVVAEGKKVYFADAFGKKGYLRKVKV